jgi:hypothetical protein
MCFWSETNTVFREDRVNEETLAHHLQAIREMIARTLFASTNILAGTRSDHGKLSLIERHMDRELLGWYEKFGKPVIISEYGADTIAGFHQIPAAFVLQERWTGEHGKCKARPRQGFSYVLSIIKE